MDPDRHVERGPAEILRTSPSHQRFLEHTVADRDLESARVLLKAEWRYIHPLLSGRENLRVLDLACGLGRSAVSWSEWGAAVVGIDFDRDLLVEGRRAGAKMPSAGPAWICGDATGLPLRSAAFDVVFCNSLFEHVPNWRAALAEMARVLKPGGLAILYTTNRHCPLQQEVRRFPFYSWLPDRLKRPILGWIMTRRRDLVGYTDFPAIHWFTFPRMRRAFEAVGLEPFDRLDVLAGTDDGLRSGIARSARRWPRLKIAYYFYSISMALYGIKRG